MAARSHYPTHGSANVIIFPHRYKGHGPFDDDYRGRMTVYGVVFLMTCCLVAGGVWLVTAITSIPTHVDCNFSRHRPCHHYPNPPEPVRLVGMMH
jgi:hypothetical protein